ncbi:MAG TPA: ABC transporter ATP-binding protein [Candidatus Limnocylindria bacterium]|nr:ABC transporter ATP-binding protein [Candidatus Limnocylindria bacterium]
MTVAPAIPPMKSPSTSLLEVRGLTTVVEGDGWESAAVDDVSFSIARGEIVGVVGESGSGKSLTALSILGLVARPVSVRSGSVRFDGQELIGLGGRELRRIRGARISMIFQEPMTSLDGAFTIGDQMIETVRAHRPVNREAAETMAVTMLDRVGIASARQRLRAYPHEFSGGMRQRVMIAMALLLHPELLLADEPTTALDVTTQAQILELIGELRREMGLSVILISHDLAAVLDVADRIVVMYAGRVVEVATGEESFVSPLHPYTQGLIRSKLSLRDRGRPVAVIEGQVPGLGHRPMGCRFATRCPNRIDRCITVEPALVAATDGPRLLRCHNPSAWVEP